MGGDSSIFEFDALQHDDVLELLVQCIAQLPLTPKTVLAMYYHENLELTEIAACLDLTECEIEQIRAETVWLLQTMLAGQIGLPELPASLEQPRDADGTGFLVNGH
jgi:DNA-directed RNA polymerase specialized sigma subunit